MIIFCLVFIDIFSLASMTRLPSGKMFCDKWDVTWSQSEGYSIFNGYILFQQKKLHPNIEVGSLTQAVMPDMMDHLLKEKEFWEKQLLNYKITLLSSIL